MKSITRICCQAMLLLLMVGLLAATASACPTCKDGIASSDPEHARMAAGYFYSIIFMISMPFAIASTFGGYIYISLRNAGKQRDQ